MGYNPKLGDIFYIELNENRLGIGVVASKWGSECYFVMFEESFTMDNLPKEINELTPFIASASLRSKLWHKHWKVFMKTSDLKRFRQPIYKIKETDGWSAVSHDTTFDEKITEDIAETLNYRIAVAPIRLEKALKAHFGIGDWESDWDKLLYSSQVFEI